MVEEFGPLCEVQSDKAAVEITSRYTGTVARLHHQPGDMVQVGEGAIPILRAAVCTQTSTVACRQQESAASQIWLPGCRVFLQMHAWFAAGRGCCQTAQLACIALLLGALSVWVAHKCMFSVCLMPCFKSH